MKKLLSIVLAVAMLVCMLPAAAFADEEPAFEINNYLAIADTKSLGEETTGLKTKRSYNDDPHGSSSNIPFDKFAEVFIGTSEVTTGYHAPNDLKFNANVNSFISDDTQSLNSSLTNDQNFVNTIKAADFITYDMGYGDLYVDRNTSNDSSSSLFFSNLTAILAGKPTNPASL